MFDAASQFTPGPIDPTSDAPARDDGLRVARVDRLPHVPNGSPHHASPSLRQLRTDGPTAFEFKFLLAPDQAVEVEARLAHWLRPDPHSEAGNGYRVTTLYCDTPQWDVFHRQGRYRLFKLRLRRYGQAEQVYLERKAKRRDEVRKLRSRVAIEHLPAFAEAELALQGYGAWYHRQLRRNQLRPVCLVEYQRSASYGLGEYGPVRLTFDRQIHGGLVDGWSFDMPGRTQRVLADRVVCEFKFRGVLPAAFKSVIEAMKLSPGRASKYRLCVQALGALNGVPDEHLSTSENTNDGGGDAN